MAAVAAESAAIIGHSTACHARVLHRPYAPNFGPQWMAFYPSLSTASFAAWSVHGIAVCQSPLMPQVLGTSGPAAAVLCHID